MKVILFTDNQIDDLVNFCCNNVQKSLFYADITFELGPFFLLVTSYKNTSLLVKGSDTSPAMIGPHDAVLVKR